MRLFIGIDLPHEVKESLVHFQAELKELGVTGYWKAQDNFHITLEFLGELDPSCVPILSEVMTKVVQGRKSFRLSIEGLGGFPNMVRPHTLWSAVRGDIEDLKELRNDLHSELEIRGFHLEKRKFRPHITLASRPHIKNIDLSKVSTLELGEFMVKEVVLFESSSVGRKRVYTDLFSVSLLD